MEEYSEFLYEMASVRAYKLDSQILLAVNPDVHRQGLAYFKMYNSNSVDDIPYTGVEDTVMYLMIGVKFLPDEL